MNLSAPLRVRVEKDICIRIHRTLLGKGTINALLGQEVTPSDIIGTAAQSGGFRIVNLAQALQVVPQEVPKYMKRTLGQRIYKDELLAYKDGGFLKGKAVVTSPTDGILDFLNSTGELRITFLPKKTELPAGVYGIIERVDLQKGFVIIKTQASIVHGVFGTGKVRDGMLHIISERDGLVDRSFISPKLDRQVLVGGSIVLKDAITSAISAGISGMISGGINANDYKSMAGGRLIFPKRMENDIGISVIACEGFGSIPIGDDIYEILKRFDGKYVSIDGNSAVINLPSFESSSLKKVRSTKLPPIQDDTLVTSDQQQNQIVDLNLGLKVRIIGNSFAGSIGKIVAIDQSKTVLPSGLKVFMATIETRRRKVQVPVANIEVIL